MKEYLPILKKTLLFQGLSDMELTAILDCQSPHYRRYAKHDYLLHAGETAHSIGIVLEGSVTILKEDLGGNCNVLAKLGPGELFAEEYACAQDQPMDVSVMTDEGTTVLFLDVMRILTICPSDCSFHARLIRNLLSAVAQKNLQLNRTLTHLAQRTTREKLLSYLSEESLKQGSASFTIPYNRQQLADYLSVNRSAMSKELGLLQEEGILQFHKNEFTLLNHIGINSMQNRRTIIAMMK
jgi:CRP-like cAMP-binding protein